MDKSYQNFNGDNPFCTFLRVKKWKVMSILYVIKVWNSLFIAYALMQNKTDDPAFH